MSEPEKHQARVDCRSVMIEYPGAGGRLVVVDIAIDCPVCGQYVVHFHGHHLRTIRDFLIATIDQYPELTRSEYQLVDHVSVTGPGNNPSRS